jgi:hypothetical protein
VLADGSENRVLGRYERKKTATAEMSCLRPGSKYAPTDHVRDGGICNAIQIRVYA